MGNPWFRMYNEIVDDEKLLLLAFEDRWHYVAILALKNKGVLDDVSDHQLLWRKVAVKLGLDLRSLEEVARRLEQVGLVDGKTFQPTGWQNRQFSSDSGAERQKKYRERVKEQQLKKALHNGDVTVTLQEEETEAEEEQERRSKQGTKHAARFRPPTLEEVRDFCVERGNRVNPESFIDFYTANGWVQGKGKPLKDWRAAVRTWERTERGGTSANRPGIELPQGDDMLARAALWNLCQEAGITADEVAGKPTAAIRSMILTRHPRAVAQ